MKPRKSLAGEFPNAIRHQFVASVITVVTGFGDFPVSSWKTNLNTTLGLFQALFFSLRKRILIQEINSTNSLHSVMPRGLSLLCKVPICHSKFLGILKVLLFGKLFLRLRK